MIIPPPPASVQDLIEALGLENTLLLIERRGGVPFQVPKGVDNSSAAARSALEAEFGVPMVQALIRRYGGGEITVPLARQWRIAVYAQRGLSTREIARKTGAHVQTVHRTLHRRINGAQIEMPFGAPRTRVSETRR